MRLHTTLFVFVTLIAAACEQPTAPELLAKIDHAERTMASDTTGERRFIGQFAGSWGLIRLLPNGNVERNLVADVDGKEGRFKAFVFERVVVRLDPNDGYSCPLGTRELLAIEGGYQAFRLSGSDFNQSIRERDDCPANSAWRPGAAPSLGVYASDSSRGFIGVSGTAHIDDAARTGDCSFLKVDRSFPLKVDCELRDYDVELHVGLKAAKADLSAFLSTRPLLNVSRQRVPGLRLVVHCNERKDTVGGCESVPFKLTR